MTPAFSTLLNHCHKIIPEKTRSFLAPLIQAGANEDAIATLAIDELRRVAKQSPSNASAASLAIAEYFNAYRAEKGTFHPSDQASGKATPSKTMSVERANQMLNHVMSIAARSGQSLYQGGTITTEAPPPPPTQSPDPPPTQSSNPWADLAAQLSE